MVQAAEKKQDQLGIHYGELEYLSVDTFLSDFKPCPLSLYIRGHIPDGRVEELAETLKITSKPLTYQVQDAIKWFVLSPETVAKWKCADDVSPNTRYIINGTTRYTTLKALREDEKTANANFLPVPTIEAFLNDFPDDGIVYDIQIQSNDTTAEHKTVAKYRAIANLINRKVSLGVPLAEARKQCARISGFTPSTVSHAEKFIDTEDMSSDVIEERKKLFDLLDDGRLSVDSVITIIQIVDKLGEKLNLTYSKVLEELAEIFPVVIKPGQTIFSKTQIANYKKQLEKKVEEQEKAANQPQQNESSEEKNETENPTENTTATVTQEQIEKAKDAIAIVVPELIDTKPEEIENIDNYRTSSIKLLKVASRLVKVAKPAQYKALYENLAAIVSDVLNDSDIKLEDKDLVAVGEALEDVRNALTKPARKKPSEDISAEDEEWKKRQQELDLQSVTSTEKPEDEIGF